MIRSGVYGLFCGARRRIGFAWSHCAEPLNTLFTNEKVSPPPEAEHVIQQNLFLASAAVGEPRLPRSVDYDLQADAGAERRVENVWDAERLRTASRVVGVTPATTWVRKQWNPERFRELVSTLTRDGTRVVVVNALMNMPVRPVNGAMIDLGGASTLDGSAYPSDASEGWTWKPVRSRPDGSTLEGRYEGKVEQVDDEIDFAIRLIREYEADFGMYYTHFLDEMCHRNWDFYSG